MKSADSIDYWTQGRNGGRLDRRRFLGDAVALGAGLAALGLVGCGDDDGDWHVWEGSTEPNSANPGWVGKTDPAFALLPAELQGIIADLKKRETDMNGAFAFRPHEPEKGEGNVGRCTLFVHGTKADIEHMRDVLAEWVIIDVDKFEHSSVWPATPGPGGGDGW